MGRVLSSHVCARAGTTGPHRCGIEQTTGRTSPYVVNHHSDGSTKGRAGGGTGQVEMTNEADMNDLWRQPLSPSKAAATSRRRFFLNGLAALALFPATLSVLHLRSQPTVIIRNGWVLAKED